MFNLFKKKEAKGMDIASEIVALADGKMIDVSTVNDETFAQKMLGESVAFVCAGETVACAAPISGTLTAMFPTGHAYGITSDQGVEILVHIGIDTVSANGKGFTPIKKQGDRVKAGEIVVNVAYDELCKEYEMPIMLIVTNANGKTISFKEFGDVRLGETVGEIN